MRAFLILATLTLALGVTSQARAASIAYIDNGEVWLSSLDGAQKVRLAAPVVNTSGAIDKWLDVAAADSGRIVAVRNEPGKTARLSWFKVWEPDGTSTVEGPMNALSGWSLYVYPLSFDLTADGKHMVYGYSNTNLLSVHLRSGHVRAAGLQQPARPDQPLGLGAPDAVREPGDRALGHDDLRAGSGDDDLRLEVHAVAEHRGHEARTAPDGHRRQWPTRRVRRRAVGHREADDRQDRRRLDQRGRSGPDRRRGLLRAGQRRRQGSVGVTGRALHRVERRSGPQGRRRPGEHRRSLRDDLAGGRDLAHRRACRDRRRERRPLPPARPRPDADNERSQPRRSPRPSRRSRPRSRRRPSAPDCG